MGGGTARGKKASERIKGKKVKKKKKGGLKKERINSIREKKKNTLIRNIADKELEERDEQKRGPAGPPPQKY